MRPECLGSKSYILLEQIGALGALKKTDIVSIADNTSIRVFLCRNP